MPPSAIPSTQKKKTTWYRTQGLNVFRKTQKTTITWRVSGEGLDWADNRAGQETFKGNPKAGPWRGLCLGTRFGGKFSLNEGRDKGKRVTMLFGKLSYAIWSELFQWVVIFIYLNLGGFKELTEQAEWFVWPAWLLVAKLGIAGTILSYLQILQWLLSSIKKKPGVIHYQNNNILPLRQLQPA